MTMLDGMDWSSVGRLLALIALVWVLRRFSIINYLIRKMQRG